LAVDEDDGGAELWLELALELVVVVVVTGKGPHHPKAL
jgi:hypothetical protein